MIRYSSIVGPVMDIVTRAPVHGFAAGPFNFISSAGPRPSFKLSRHLGYQVQRPGVPTIRIT
jgi:hypothetical protein